MGNRAIIKTAGGHIGLYLHWNGGRDSVEAFLKYCDLRGFRSPETDGYGWARLAQVIGNFFGGGLSLGMVELSGDHDGEYCDNGTYVIEKWQIVGREDFDGEEQQEYKLSEMLLSIDEAQPEKEQIGEYLKAKEIKVSDLKIGDTVIFQNWNCELEKGVVIGYGADRSVNGQNVLGIPYLDRYGNGQPEENINNYLLSETVRVIETVEEVKEENPVEIFINDKLNGVELKFKSKPDEETREALKAKGFRWHFKKAVWYAKKSPDTMELAQKIAKAATM